MLKKLATEVARVGRTASKVFWFTPVLALIAGAAVLMAFAANGNSSSTTIGITLNADRPVGLQPAASLTGSAEGFQGKANIAPGNRATILILSQPRLRLTYDCPADLSANGEVILKNTGTAALNVISDREGSPGNVQYALLAPGDVQSRAPEPIGDRITFQAQAQDITTIDVFSAHRTTAGGFSTNDCHVQAQALVTS